MFTEKYSFGKSHLYINPEIHLWILCAFIKTEVDLTPYKLTFSSATEKCKRRTAGGSVYSAAKQTLCMDTLFEACVDQ